MIRPTTSAVGGRGWRERVSLSSLAQFVGLGPLGRRLARSALFRTRARALRTGAVAVTLVAAILLALVTVPPARDYIFRVPGAVANALGGGATTADTSKQYPRIYSTKLNIDIQIKPGDGSAPPVQPIAFQFPDTAPVDRAPTEVGNTYLYAHDRPGMFRGLHSAHPDDVVVIALTPDRKEYFKVTEIHTNVAWNDKQWLQPSDDNRLTLQTCNYSGDYDPRFVVVAQRISDDAGRAVVGNA